jgi:hypothetical protein
LIKRGGYKAGHTDFAIHGAKKKLDVAAKSCGFPRKTFWFLPGAVEASSRVTSGRVKQLK